ncbi:hypothetical protein H2203_001210 [Taxawa tesnikishii (nom. ined.)]|nr:hypothetical protein H2203_001210 [Dothideales sp. JES 119]
MPNYKGFMDLPPELRLMIYDFAITRSFLHFGPHPNGVHQFVINAFNMTPLQLNRQVRMEAAPYFFARDLTITITSSNIRDFVHYVRLLPPEHQSMLLGNANITFRLSFGFHARRSSCLAPHNYADTHGFGQLLALLFTRATHAAQWQYQFPGCTRCTDVIRDHLRAIRTAALGPHHGNDTAPYRRQLRRQKVGICGRMLQTLK